jgi:hypothetical protein
LVKKWKVLGAEGHSHGNSHSHSHDDEGHEGHDHGEEEHEEDKKVPNEVAWKMLLMVASKADSFLTKTFFACDSI